MRCRSVHVQLGLSDVGFGELRRQLEYKVPMYGGQVKIISRWAPSSKTCSNCGCIKDFIALSERVFQCTACGFKADRDLNAAINIRTLGLRGSHARGPEGSGCPTRKSRGTKPCRVEAGTTTGANSRLLTR